MLNFFFSFAEIEYSPIGKKADMDFKWFYSAKSNIWSKHPILLLPVALIFVIIVYCACIKYA